MSLILDPYHGPTMDLWSSRGRCLFHQHLDSNLYSNLLPRDFAPNHHHVSHSNEVFKPFKGREPLPPFKLPRQRNMSFQRALWFKSPFKRVSPTTRTGIYIWKHVGVRKRRRGLKALLYCAEAKSYEIEKECYLFILFFNKPVQ